MAGAPSIGNGNGKYRILAEINMIPLIDVSLVLLIIFMVMTPFLVKSQIRINVPKADSVDARLTRDNSIQVQVRQDGAVFIDGQAIKTGEIEAALRQRLKDPQSQAVIVEADKDARFQGAVSVLDAAKKVGATKLAICVRRESATGGGGKPPAPIPLAPP